MGIINNPFWLLLKKVLVCSFLLVFFTLPAFSQTNDGEIQFFYSDINSVQLLPLSDVLRDVVKTNPEILESMHRYQSIERELGLAKSGYKPTLDGEVSIGQEVTKGYDTNYDSKDLTGKRAGIYARQNVFSGMHTSSYVKETEARVKAAAYDVLNVANRVFLDVAEAYLVILRSSELLNLAKENVITQAQILRQIEEKTSSGFGRASDLSNSKSRFALAKSNFISNQQDLNQAIVRFQRQFGRIIRPEVLIAPEPSGNVPSTLEETIELALRNHPALKVANYNIAVRQHTMDKEKSTYWPTLDLELNAEHSKDVGGDEGWTNNAGVFLKLKYSFYDGGVRKARKATNYEEMLKEYQRSYIERRNVNETVGLAWNIFVAEQVKKLYLSEHVDMSEKTLVEFKEEYHLGRRDLLELLDMEAEYFTARDSFLQSKYSFLIAYYRLIQSTGVLLREFETGLFEVVGLNDYKDEFDYALYEKFGEDKDNDNVKDIFDQCDNSLEGEDTFPFGCFDKKGMLFGLELPDEEDIEPYIVPGQIAYEENIFDIDEEKEEQSFYTDIINFNFDSDKLTEEAKEYLIEIADYFKSLSNYNIEILGHTDTWGNQDYNKKLSQRRAESVLNQLVMLGVNRDVMSAIGIGDAQPLVSNQTLEGRQKNRRIEFKFTKN